MTYQEDKQWYDTFNTALKSLLVKYNSVIDAMNTAARIADSCYDYRPESFVYFDPFNPIYSKRVHEKRIVDEKAKTA